MTPRRPGSGPLIAVAMGAGALVAFLLPGGTVFGILLVLVCLAYSALLATGMDPYAGSAETAARIVPAVATVRGAAMRLGSDIWSRRRPPAPPGFAPPAARTPAPAPAPVDPTTPSTTPSAESPAPTSAETAAPSTPPAVTPVSLTKTAPTPAVPIFPVVSGATPQPPAPASLPPGPPPVITPPSPSVAKSRIPLIATALTLVVAVVVGAAAYAGLHFWQSRDTGVDRQPTTFASGMVHRSFPTAPSAAFAVTPAQMGTDNFLRPNYVVGGEELTGYLRSDRFLITGMRGGGLIAIDPGTGREAWRQTGYRGLRCSDVFDDETIGCTTSDGLVLLSAADGSEIAKLPGDYVVVQKTGDKYAYAKRDASTATVSLGTRTNPTAFWSHTEQISGGTRTRLDVSDDVVVYSDVSYTGGWSLAYTASGQRIGGRADPGSLISPGLYTAHPPGDSALVFDGRGTQRYFTSSTPAQPRLYAPSPGMDVAFTFDSAIDPTDGRTRWPMPWASSDVSGDLVAVVGTVAVLNSADKGRAVGIDLPTGRTLWERPAISFSYDLTTDGRRIIGTSDVGERLLFAMDIATGETSWSVSLPDVGESMKVVAVGDDIVVVGMDAIVGFHPTGGPAEVFAGDTGTPAGQAAGSTTRCTKPPRVTPVTFSVDGQNLVVRLKFTPGCSSGDVLSNSIYQVTVRDRSSVVASSSFDLAASPLALAGGQDTMRDFAFPVGTYFRLPSSLAGGSGSSTSVDAGDESVECSGVGVDRIAPGQKVAVSSGGGVSFVGTPQVAAQTGVDLRTNAIDALRAQADADRPLVQSQYLDRWLAQISAKQVRTPPMTATDVDDRTMVTWTPEQILRQHLTLRARYPEVRLLWSDEWRTFDLRGWWITVAQPNVLDAVGANAWCDAKAIAPNQCFAKLVSNSRGSDGTTAYRPGTTG